MTREEATNNVFMGINLRHIVHIAVGFVDAMWLSRTDVITFIDKLFDDHEAELKGLKQIIQKQSDLLEMYSVDNEVPNNDYLVKQLKAKDEEIVKLREDIKCAKGVIDWYEKECKQYIKENHKKARSIVAMLFWEFIKNRTQYKEGNKYYSYDKVFESFILFLKAYKMLKSKHII